jgi:hypothetical protein
MILYEGYIHTVLVRYIGALVFVGLRRGMPCPYGGVFDVDFNILTA